MHTPTIAGSALCRLAVRPGNPATAASVRTLRRCAAIHPAGMKTPGLASCARRQYVQIASRANEPVCIPRRTPVGLPAHPPSRSFHSYDHPPPPGPFGATEATLLAAAYKHVPEHGFTTAALAFGARDAGFPDVSTSVLPDGEFGLIRWHLVQQKEALAARAAELFSETSGEAKDQQQEGTTHAYTIPQKLEMLMWERLMGNKDVIGQWQQALAVMAHPTHVAESVKMLAELADEIVFLSGDKAVDPSWYASRAGVSAIYASAELFMTSDSSPGFADTQDFLRRRMKEAKRAKSALGDVGEWVAFNAMGALNVARSWGMRV